jgi:hypothetical protein
VLAAYDSGDHLHPNDAGYRALAAALPLEMLDKLASGTMLPPTANVNDMK